MISPRNHIHQEAFHRETYHGVSVPETLREVNGHDRGNTAPTTGAVTFYARALGSRRDAKQPRKPLPHSAPFLDRPLLDHLEARLAKLELSVLEEFVPAVHRRNMIQTAVIVVQPITVDRLEDAYATTLLAFLAGCGSPDAQGRDDVVVAQAPPPLKAERDIVRVETYARAVRARNTIQNGVDVQLAAEIECDGEHAVDAREPSSVDDGDRIGGRVRHERAAHALVGRVPNVQFVTETAGHPSYTFVEDGLDSVLVT